MNLVEIALRRPLTILVLVVATVLGAWIALQRMTRDIFPPLGIPTIYVAQPYGGMDPAQMEGYLTYRYEYHFLYITGIEHVESKSIQGASIMKLQFHPGTDMSQAMSETVALRQPRAGVHAARHGRAVHHAVRRGQRRGRLPGVLDRGPEHYARPDAGPGAEPRAPGLRDAARRLGAAALRRQFARHHRQRQPRPHARLRAVAGRDRAGARRGPTRSARRAT